MKLDKHSKQSNTIYKSYNFQFCVWLLEITQSSSTDEFCVCEKRQRRIKSKQLTRLSKIQYRLISCRSFESKFLENESQVEFIEYR